MLGPREVVVAEGLYLELVMLKHVGIAVQVVCVSVSTIAAWRSGPKPKE